MNSLAIKMLARLASTLLVFSSLSAAGMVSFDTVDVPGADATYVYAINNSGQIAGAYVDSSGQHGFVEASPGVFTTFDYLMPYGTGAFGINNQGDTAGSVTPNCNGFCAQGFERVGGTFTTIDHPASPGYTEAYGITTAWTSSGYISTELMAAGYGTGRRLPTSARIFRTVSTTQVTSRDRMEPRGSSSTASTPFCSAIQARTPRKGMESTAAIRSWVTICPRAFIMRF